MFLFQDLQKFLDDSNDGVVYFTMGSMVLIETFPENIIKTLYESFSKIAPIRVLMKVPNPELLPPGLPKNVITHPWMPQQAVLGTIILLLLPECFSIIHKNVNKLNLLFL